MLGGIEGTEYTLILPVTCLGVLPINNGGFPIIRLMVNYGNAERVIDQIQIS